MRFNQLHWLDIAEYISIGLTVISLFVALASGALLYPIAFLSIALVLNLVNRLRFQQRSRKRISGAMKQLQRQLSEEMEALGEKRGIPAALPVPTPTDTNALTTLQKKLLSLEESLNAAIDHLNNHSVLPARIEGLEQSFVQLRQEVSRLSRQLKESPDMTIAELELPPTVTQKPIRSVM
ncbi:MAG: WD40 repeat domain-containing protein, partial [Microcystaceae cyanobacterium]